MKIFKRLNSCSQNFFGAVTLTAAGITCCWSSHSFAQRGLIPPPEEPPAGPSSGIPGFFDTNLAEYQRLVGDFPTFSLDFGVTPRLTLGTSMLTLLTAPALLNPKEKNPSFLNFKARYSLFREKEWSAALTGYWIRLSREKSTTVTDIEQLNQETIYLGAGSLNVAKTSSFGSFGFSTLFATSSSSNNASQIKTTFSSQSIKILSAWGRASIMPSLEGETLLSYCPSAQRTEISDTLRIDVREACYGKKIWDPIVRGLLNWRTSDNWLFSAGVIWIPGLRTRLFPILSFHYLTPRLFENADKKEPDKEWEHD